MKHYIIYVVLADVVGKIGEVENSAFECINQHLKEMIESKEGRKKHRVKVSTSVEVEAINNEIPEQTKTVPNFTTVLLLRHKFYRVKGSTVHIC